MALKILAFGGFLSAIVLGMILQPVAARQQGRISVVTALALGYYHACALAEDGDVRCWGYNGRGQLGDGSLDERRIPGDIVPLGDKAVNIAAGGYHTCAVTRLGSVQCWGANYGGQLGVETETCDLPDPLLDQPCSTQPVTVPGLANVTQIAMSFAHTCALTEQGYVKCWGTNDAGQLGDGTTEDRTSPVDVVGLPTGAVAISVGMATTCALIDSGEVWCWGRNRFGSLGDGTTVDSAEPVAVCADAACEQPLGEVATIASGFSHTCALTNTGNVKCWGFNGFGELGVPSTDETCEFQSWAPSCSTTPLDVRELEGDVVDITAGAAYSCSLTALGGVKCWGLLPGKGCCTGHARPVDIRGAQHNVMAVIGGGEHACLLTDEGFVECWGNNYHGQLGIGITRDIFAPAGVWGLSSRGDVDCDLAVSTFDSRLVLEVEAEHVIQVPCPDGMDTNEDGMVNSLDAALILQYVAGLLGSLPP